MFLVCIGEDEIMDFYLEEWFISIYSDEDDEFISKRMICPQKYNWGA